MGILGFYERGVSEVQNTPSMEKNLSEARVVLGTVAVSAHGGYGARHWIARAALCCITLKIVACSSKGPTNSKPLIVEKAKRQSGPRKT